MVYTTTVYGLDSNCLDIHLKTLLLVGQIKGSVSCGRTETLHLAGQIKGSGCYGRTETVHLAGKMKDSIKVQFCNFQCAYICAHYGDLEGNETVIYHTGLLPSGSPYTHAQFSSKLQFCNFQCAYICAHYGDLEGNETVIYHTGLLPSGSPPRTLMRNFRQNYNFAIFNAHIYARTTGTWKAMKQ
jgi:hypothetical protein